MNIVITESKVRFRAPVPGQQTRPIAEHYAGRRILALVDGKERMFLFEKDELPYYASESEMIAAIQNLLAKEG